MLGLEVAAAAAVAYLIRKTGRVRQCADQMVDEVLDTGIDRLAELVENKLGDDPALRRLTEQSRAGAPSERTEHRVTLALADAADEDPEFATALMELVQALQAHETEAGTGTVHNVISGSTVHGSVIQARDLNGPLTIGGPAPRPAGPPEGETPPPS